MAKIELVMSGRFWQMLRNNSGVGMIEAAVILPILLAIVFAGIEFGFYFSKQSVTQNAVGVVAATVQTYSPNVTASDATNLNANLQNLYTSLGSGSITFAANNFCGKAFPTQTAAQSFIDGADPCAGSTGFHVGRDDAGVTAGDPYYVGFVSRISYNSFTPMSALSGIVMPSHVVSKLVVYVSPSFGSGGGSLPGGCSNGQVVKLISGSWSCGDDNSGGGGGLPTPPSCSSSNQALQWNGASFACTTISGGGGGSYTPPTAYANNPTICSSGNALRWTGAAWVCESTSGGGGGGLPTPPTSTNPNQALYWNGTTWAYRSFTAAPTCSANNILAWNGSSYVCLPYPSGCPANSLATWTGSSFSCIPFSATGCTANTAVYWDGSKLACTAASNVVAAGGGRGGIYMKGRGGSSSACRFSNPLTGSCSCPAGYTAYQFWDFWGKDSFYENSGAITMWQCIK